MTAHDVVSPCINICKIDEPSQRCLGCDRTIDEITRWSGMDNEARQAVIDDIVLRRKARQKSTGASQPSSENLPR